MSDNELDEEEEAHVIDFDDIPDAVAQLHDDIETIRLSTIKHRKKMEPDFVNVMEAQLRLLRPNIDQILVLLKNSPEERKVEYKQDVKMIALADWYAEGEKLFGKDKMFWYFKCPSCGNIQCAEDFRQFKDKGATPEKAYRDCIGRYTGSNNKMLSGVQPCNYAVWGLFMISHTVVVHEDGKELPVFDFATPEEVKNRKFPEGVKPW